MATNKKAKKPAKAAKSAKPAKKAKKAGPSKKANKPARAAKPAKSAKPDAKSAAADLSRVITPLDDRLVVRVERFERTAGGLFIPATASDRPQQGKVLAVGRGRRDKKGRVRPMDVKVGDEIYFANFSGAEIKILSEELLILREADVLGVVET